MTLRLMVIRKKIWVFELKKENVRKRAPTRQVGARWEGLTPQGEPQCATCHGAVKPTGEWATGVFFLFFS